MRYELDLADPLAAELDQMVMETTGMDAIEILQSIAKEYLAPRIAQRAERDAKVRLSAFDAAKDVDTKAAILSTLGAKKVGA
jgi:hypothetical protein